MENSKNFRYFLIFLGFVYFPCQIQGFISRELDSVVEIIEINQKYTKRADSVQPIKFLIKNDILTNRDIQLSLVAELTIDSASMNPEIINKNMYPYLKFSYDNIKNDTYKSKQKVFSNDYEVWSIKQQSIELPFTNIYVGEELSIYVVNRILAPSNPETTITFKLKVYYQNKINCILQNCLNRGTCQSGDCFCFSNQFDKDCTLETETISIDSNNQVSLLGNQWKFYSWPIQSQYLPEVSISYKDFTGDLNLKNFIFTTNNDIKFNSIQGTSSATLAEIQSVDGKSILMSIENSVGQVLIMGIGNTQNGLVSGNFKLVSKGAQAEQKDESNAITIIIIIVVLGGLAILFIGFFAYKQYQANRENQIREEQMRINAINKVPNQQIPNRNTFIQGNFQQQLPVYQTDNRPIYANNNYNNGINNNANQQNFQSIILPGQNNQYNNNSSFNNQIIANNGVAGNNNTPNKNVSMNEIQINPNNHVEDSSRLVGQKEDNIQDFELIQFMTQINNPQVICLNVEDAVKNGVILREEINENFECPMCLEALGKKSMVATIVCKHVFHVECLSKWLQGHQNCPYCREILIRPEIKKLN